MRRYSHAFRVLMDQELFNLLAEASTKTGIPKSRFVRYAMNDLSQGKGWEENVIRSLEDHHMVIFSGF